MIAKEGVAGGDGATAAIFKERNSFRRLKFRTLLYSDPSIPTTNQQDETNYYLSRRNSNASAGSAMSRDTDTDTTSSSPYFMSPLNQSSPYYSKSPWTRASPLISVDNADKNLPQYGLIGSLVREEGHIYSLAVSGDLLYTGSDSNNIRVWKNSKDYSGFKSNSGLVKAIVVSGETIFTGHQDGKIRVWKFSPKNHRKPYKRLGSLPTAKDFLKSSFNPRSYIEVRRHRNVPWIKHFDAVSCMSLDEDQGILYSGSWDKTLKVWRISESKCLESINAHDDAINSIVAGFKGFVLTGSADGTVKVWRRELLGKTSKHVLMQTLLKQENAVTALVVNAAAAATIYCGSSDGLVNFWESEKQLAHRGVIRGHKLAVLCLATAGNLMFSGSADKSICVWRRNEGGDHSCLSVLTGHSGPVKCLAVEEDQGESLKGDQRWIVYSGSLDKSVKIWRVSQNAPDLNQFRGVV